MLRRYIPTKTKLVRSFKLRSKEFLRENSLAGVPYFVNPQRPTWERILWFIWTVAAFCGAIVISFTIWQQFQQNPTLVSISMETESLVVPYPSLYICMTSDYLVLQGLPKSVARLLISFYNWNSRPIKLLNRTLHETFSKMMWRKSLTCNALLSNCTDGKYSVPCRNFFTKVITSAGVCCKSRSKLLNKGDDADNITVSFVRPILNKRLVNLFLVQFDDDDPLRFSQVDYRLNREVKIVIEFLVTESSSSLRSLPDYQRKCVFPDEKPPYRTCWFRCARDKLIKVCNCVPWFMKAQQWADECTQTQYNCLIKNAKEMRLSECTTSCYLYCDHVSYLITEIKNSNRTEIGIKWPTYSYKRDVSFGWLDLIVSFGGIMGVFLGYSIITTIELVYYFTLRSYCGAVVDEDDDNAFKVIQVAEKPKKKPESTEIYYDYRN